MWTVLAQSVHASPAPGYALGWGTLSLINAGLAQSKNHSGLLWWFLSLLLGPVATFIIVVFLDKREGVVDRGYRPDVKEYPPEV